MMILPVEQLLRVDIQRLTRRIVERHTSLQLKRGVLR